VSTLVQSLEEQRVAMLGKVAGEVTAALGRVVPFVVLYASNMRDDDLRALLHQAATQHKAAELLATAHHTAPGAKA
jgi:hypothetical protein